MNIYPLKIIVSLLFCATFHFAGAQSIHITLGSMAHPEITQSLICISDFQGKVYFEQFLTPDEIEYSSPLFTNLSSFITVEYFLFGTILSVDTPLWHKHK